jgi:hypothetical protein
VVIAIVVAVLALRRVTGQLELATASEHFAVRVPAPCGAGVLRAIGMQPIDPTSSLAPAAPRWPIASRRAKMWNDLRALIRAEIAATVHDLRVLKPWTRLPRQDRGARPDTRFDLITTKARATLLCTIIAHSRGRIHRCAAHDGLAAQAAMIETHLAALEAGRGLPLLDANIRAAARVILARRAPSPTACVAPTAEHRV